MSIPTILLTTTCDIYRPFGAGSPTTTGILCRVVAEFARGRTSMSPATMWTHRLEVDESVDIRDGCTRTAGISGISYADGDEVRIPSGGTARYVVAWVETVNPGTSRAYQRAYLIRHSA